MPIEESNPTEATPPPSYTSKESPLTDIATSPPPFLSAFDEDIEEQSEESKNGGANNHKNNNNSNSNNDESSELSDLDEDSEAETDKMDFLEDEGNSSLDHTSLDLHALSKLTEMAQMKGIDDDPEEEEKIANVPLNMQVSDGEEADAEREEDDDTDRTLNGKRRAVEDPVSEQRKKQKQNDTDLESVQVETNEEVKQDSVEGVQGEELELDQQHTHGKIEKEIKEEEDSEGDKKDETGDNKDAHEDADKTDASNVQEPEPEVAGATTKAVEDEEEADEEEAVEEEEEEDAPEIEDEEEDEVDDTETDSKRNPETDKPELDSVNDNDNDNDNEIDNDSVQDEIDMNEQRKLAIEELVSIETDFASLRDKLYHDKLQLLEHELKLCLEGSHPELSKIYYKVNGFYQDSLRYANSNLNYKLRCIDRQTIATRTSIHQDFLKSIMDSKSDMISNTTSLWYKINKERNQMDQIVAEYNFSAVPLLALPVGPLAVDEDSEIAPVVPLPKKVIKQRTLVDLVQRRNDYNQEVGIQSGLLEFHGFPSAISLKMVELNQEDDIEELILRKATEDEIQDDLRGMGILT